MKKDLPTIKAGATFKLDDKRGLVLLGGDRSTYGPFIPNVLVLYEKPVLDICPNILTDWFEEIPEEPKTVYDLEEGDKCWVRRSTVSALSPEPLHAVEEIWQGDLRQQSLRECGALFLSAEEVDRDIKQCKAREILKRDTKGFKPAVHDYNQYKWHVYWLIDKQRLEMDVEPNAMENRIYFATAEDAEASIKAHPEEWKTYLGVEE